MLVFERESDSNMLIIDILAGVYEKKSLK